MTARFVAATICGHHRYKTANGAAGVHWCHVCGRWVGLIVRRLPVKAAG